MRSGAGNDEHHWVPPVPDAAQVHDPLDGSAAIDDMVSSFKPDTD